MKPLRLNRPFVAFLHDAIMAALSFLLAIWLRLGGDLAAYPTEHLAAGIALFTAICCGVFLAQGLYRGIWRYASTNDLLAIVKAVSLATVIFLLPMFLLTRLDSLPRSALPINWFVLLILLGGPRMAYRVIKDGGLGAALRPGDSSGAPVLVIGATHAAEQFIRETARDPANAAYRVVGIVDENDARVGRSIRHVPVLGRLSELPAVLDALAARKTRPQRLVIAQDALTPDVLGETVTVAEARGMTVARLPRLSDLRQPPAGQEATGLPSDLASRIRPVAIEDLLGRPQAILDRVAMARMIAGKRVLVTGAGGTIGGELTRQIAALAPSRLTLLDASEHQLYAIDLELSETLPELDRRAALGDVRDRWRIADVLSQERPDLVFHAAALKHVPMVERNPNEGVLTNAIGTWNMAAECRAAGVGLMAMISTDKAVNPTNVMGASKRLAESICQALDVDPPASERAARTRFATVRFGNVLGSTGSVVPLFQRQLARGGPLTVTHRDVTRYFMTVKEAVELVLQSSVLAEPSADAVARGKIFVLDMGEPVRIHDLAKQLIRLAGLRPGKDIDIEFTGLRPGEKLFEELFHDGEPVEPSRISAIMVGAPRIMPYGELEPGLDALYKAALERRTGDTLTLIRKLVPEYVPDEGVRPAKAKTRARA